MAKQSSNDQVRLDVKEVRDNVGSLAFELDRIVGRAECKTEELETAAEELRNIKSSLDDFLILDLGEESEPDDDDSDLEDDAFDDEDSDLEDDDE